MDIKKDIKSITALASEYAADDGGDHSIICTLRNGNETAHLISGRGDSIFRGIISATINFIAEAADSKQKAQAAVFTVFRMLVDEVPKAWEEKHSDSKGLDENMLRDQILGKDGGEDR